MLKALITTLHFYNNFGSVLQAYALKYILKKECDTDADIFPYRPAVREWKYFTDAVLQMQYAEKTQKFDCFCAEVLGMNQRTADTVDEAFRIMGHGPGDYTAYFVGSDIVWGREFSALDKTYFLMQAPASAKKIAYAASVLIDKDGRTEDDELFRRGLKNFDAIAVRETSSVKAIQSLSELRDIEAVLDPTLLLNQSDYDSLVVENEDMKKEPYILSYFLTHDPAVVDYTNMMSKQLGLRVIHYFADYPGGIFDKKSGCFAFAGPGEFLGYVKNASLIFTNSFHGTCFSMIYRKPFYTYMAKRNMLSRVRDTIQRLHMQERYFTDIRDIEKITLNINYCEFEHCLELERKKSIEFIRSALEG